MRGMSARLHRIPRNIFLWAHNNLQVMQQTDIEIAEDMKKTMS